jgi:hypothetical protein
VLDTVICRGCGRPDWNGGFHLVPHVHVHAAAGAENGGSIAHLYDDDGSDGSERDNDELHLLSAEHGRERENDDVHHHHHGHQPGFPFHWSADLHVRAQGKLIWRA